MFKIHRIATTSFRTWGPDIIEPESRPASPTVLTPEHSVQGADLWADNDEEFATESGFTLSSPTAECSGDFKCIPDSDIQHNTPTIDLGLSGTSLITNVQTVDTVTFPSCATHLLPSEPNGTWRTKVCHAATHSNEAASTFRQVLEQYAYELDVTTFLQKLEQTAEAIKDDVNDWLNQTFADCDLIEMHNRVRRLLPITSMPDKRQAERAIDAAADIARSLRKRRSESSLPEAIQGDKYTFARLLGQKARHSLIEQGICKEWQFLSKGHVQLQHAMQLALMRTFTHIHDLDQDVPLSQAKPQWVVDRAENVWRLELDVGVVGVEVGPESDCSLIELGFIKTGFVLPESYGCVAIADLDRQAQDVEDDWQLLEL